ncbi:MAG: transposase [Rhodospirillales bacterium]|nr:transposase [Rhodospirillales bacterium]
MSDDQWALIAPMLPPAKGGGRPRSTDMRQVLNAIFYLLREGCRWRSLPKEFGPWRTV